MTAGESATGVAFHSQARAAAGYVRHDGRAAMDLGDGAEIDGEGELDLLPLAQSQVFSLDVNAVGA